MGDFAYSVHGPSGSASASGSGSSVGSQQQQAQQALQGLGGSLSRPGTSGGVLGGPNTLSPIDLGAAAGYSAGVTQQATATATSAPGQQLQGSNGMANNSSSNSNLWGYSAPSPPGTATGTRHHAIASSSGNGNSVAGPSSGAGGGMSMSGHSHVHHPHHSSTASGPPPAPSAFHGYNTANTRPMTAPSASLSGPLHFHHGAYGPMFSPAAYNGAGFPANFGAARSMPYATARRTLSHVPEDTQRPPGTAGSTADIFAHHPPPLASTSASAAYPQQQQQHQYTGYQRPGTDYSLRREDHYHRPGTSDTLRPDTALSTFSDYSTSGFGHPPGLSAAISGNAGHMHPLHGHQASTALSHSGYYANPAAGHMGTVSGHHSAYAHHPQQQQHQHPGSQYHMQQGAGYEDQNSGADKYSFVPLPSQPKKRPRRRFEEIERIYDCNYPGCNKAYGTLNHLNAHVSMQKHGPKRVPAEFKEIRKAWRQRKKENEARAAAAAARGETGDDDEEDQDNGNGSGGDQCHHQQHRRESGNGPHVHSIPSDGQYQSNPYSIQAGGGISQTTPPGSTQIPSSPSFAFYPPYGGHHQQHAQMNSGIQGTHSSDGYYYPAHGGQQQHHGGRPSTAPGTFLYNPYGASSHPNSVHGTPSFTSPVVGAGQGGTPPMLGAGGAMPAGFNPNLRKQSITSLPPAFASIQEEPASEAAAVAAGTNGLGLSEEETDAVDSAFASLTDAAAAADFDGLLDPFAPRHHAGGGGVSSTDITPSPVEARSLPSQSDTVFSYPPFADAGASAGVQHQQSASPASNGPGGQQRPATASSPFRYSTGGYADGAYDSLAKRRKSIASPLSAGAAMTNFANVGEVSLVNGLNVPPANRSDTSGGTPTSGVDITGRWSPGWSNLATYKQEIR